MGAVGAVDRLFTGTVKAPSGPTNTRALSACGGASSFITSYRFLPSVSRACRIRSSAGLVGSEAAK